jgi:hypothetical protein
VNHHALVVSLHDVSPHTRGDCECILTELAELGVRACSLLVVPNHHTRGHFLADPAFCEWLCAQAKIGHEVVIHGYHHQRARREDEDLRTQLTTRVYTADEGEFYDISWGDASLLVDRAREEFESIGLKPEGFIAPAWLLSNGAERALHQAGVQYTVLLDEVIDLETGRRTHSQSLVWSVRSAWRRVVSLVWNAMLYRGLRNNPLLRISIHPVDRHHPAIWRQVRRLIRRGLDGRAPYTYERWVALQRALRMPGESVASVVTKS